MKITVVTPTFNSEKTISRNIASVQSQDYPEIEHLFIDNKSTDRTLEIIEELYRGKSNFRIISEKDKGISDAFSKGVMVADSEIVAILNSDDEYVNSSILAQVAKAFEDTNIVYVHGDMEFVDEEYGTNIRKPLLCDIQYGMPFNHPSFFVRKSLYEEIGSFKLEYRFAMDFEWVCRLFNEKNHERFQGFYLEQSGPLVRMHAGGASDINELKSIDEVERALKEHGLWNFSACRYQFLRRLRIRLKKILSNLGLNSIIKIWRQFKWG